MTAAVFESFFAHSREALCVLGGDGRIHHTNGALLVVLGCAEAELVGRSCAELLHPDDRDRAEKELTALVARGVRGTFDARWRQPDGSYRWLSWQADPHGDVLYCRLRAVTMTDEPLVQSLCDALPCPVFALAADTTCALSNEAHARLFGKTTAEIVGTRIDQLAYPTELREALRGQSERVLSTGEPAFLREVPFVTHEGRFVSFQVRTIAVRIGGKMVALSVAEDITERRAAEAALARSESSFRRLIEGAPDAIFVYRAGIVVYANPLAGRILGYQEPTDLVDLPFRELVAVEDRDAIEGLRVAPHELKMLRRDGTFIFVEATVHFVDFDGQEATLLFARDVTERRQIQAQLQHAARMVSVGTLAAGVAHEINNPLAYVLANIDHIERSVRKVAALQEAAPVRDQLAEIGPALADAASGARRVRDIVGDLRTFSNPQDDMRRSLDVRTVLDAAINMADNEIRHRAQLVREFGDVPRVLASDSRLSQVFLNLLVNAVQALPESGSNVIRVATRTSQTGAAIIEVHDSGIGIEPGLLARVFDPFYTTKPVGVGTGLGLSICHAIVESHGGTIEIESEPGRGTVARVTLPATMPSLRSRTVTPPPSVPGGAKRLNVLVVDDEPPIGRVFQKILGRQHSVRTVLSAEEALSAISQARFDVIFCDLMMPGLSGADVFERATATRPELARTFVFMTGGAFTASARAFLARVPNPCLAKPFDVAEIRRVLKEVGGLAARSPSVR